MSGSHQLYRSPILDELWDKGYCLIGELTFDSAAYVARYIMKKITGPQAEQHYAGRKPEYTTMSRRPGIGKAWLDRYGSEVFREDSVIINGKPARPPRYYDSQYEITNPEDFDQVKSSRIRKAAKHHRNNTPERLRVREKVQEAKQSLSSRDLF